MIERNKYLNEISSFSKNNLIKVISGIRRSGKSTVVSQLITHLKLKRKDYLYYDFSNETFFDIANHKDLNNFLKKQLNKNITTLFFDEIQNIEQWEKVILSLENTKKYDIYLTGSNSKLLSTDLSTLLSGRYVSFNINTLSFKEFTQFNEENSFDKYLRLGGFPAISDLGMDENQARVYLRDVINSVVIKDIVQKYNVRDIDFLYRLLLFISDSVGSILSINSINNYMKNDSKADIRETIKNYLEYLESACVINKVKRFDIKGKKLFETKEKYFLADHGIANALFSFSNNRVSKYLENIVFRELQNKGFERIDIGEFDNLEVDFVAEKSGVPNYFQVSYLMEQDETFAREILPLKKIKNQYPKTILTLDQTRVGNVDGIEVIYLPDWLLALE